MPKPIGCKSCSTKPKCFTDYKPHYAPNLSLSELLVGNTSWRADFYKDFNPELPDKTHIEMRPGYSAPNGGADGEIFVRLNIGDSGNVFICGYNYSPSIYHALEFRLELDVPDDRLRTYVPSEDRKKWTSFGTIDDCSEMTNVPRGQHVVGLKAKYNELKLRPGITHVITYD